MNDLNHRMPHLIYVMKNDLCLRKKQLVEEFDMYVKRNYGLDVIITDRL